MKYPYIVNKNGVGILPGQKSRRELRRIIKNQIKSSTQRPILTA